MIRVKLSFPYPEWNILRQTPSSSGIWKGYQFFVNEEIGECDYWVVFNHLLRQQETVKCAPEKTILLTGEPYVIQKYESKFLQQFSHIITCQQEIKHPRVTYFHQGHPWFVGAQFVQGKYERFTKSYDELIQTEFIEKKKIISIITSNKQFTDGHKRRFDFVMALKDYFGDSIDLFGRGVKDFEDKWDALADYKYSVAIENYVCDDWLTEKIYDCFLAHTFPFYYGPPNVNRYFSHESFELIDIESLDNSRRTIERVLNLSDHYAKHLPFVLESKLRYLNHYNIFPLIASFIEGLETNETRPSQVTLKNNYQSLPSIKTRIYSKLRNAYRKIIK